MWVPYPVDGFHGWEKRGSERWIWSRGDAGFRFPVPAKRRVRVRFEASLGATVARKVTLSIGGSERLRISLEPGKWVPIDVEFEVDPLSELRIVTDRPPSEPTASDARPLAFCFRDPRAVRVD